MHIFIHVLLWQTVGDADSYVDCTMLVQLSNTYCPDGYVDYIQACTLFKRIVWYDEDGGWEDKLGSQS